VPKHTLSLSKPNPVGQFGKGVQLGTRWSKVALEKALRTGQIHFHLDGLGDVNDIITKQGTRAYNVTIRELRYVWRHWNRATDPFKGHVTFYNGFDATDHETPMVIPCPWDP
jgi:hypothetical protein